MTDLLTHIDAGVGAATGIRTCIRNVRAVTPRGIVDDATVTIQGGVIVEVAERGTPSPGAFDGRGAFLIPGLIDACSDGLEKESSPRPNVQLPFDFALRSFEGRLRAAGITTVLHAVAFEDDPGRAHTVEVANEMCDAIEAHRASHDAIVDHRITSSVDVNDVRGIKALSKLLVTMRAHAGTRTSDLPDPAPLVRVSHRTRHPDQRTPTPALPSLIRAAASGEIRLMTCGPHNAVDIDDADEWHASLVGFPTTMVAAVAARERGMLIVAAAPDVLRGPGPNRDVSTAELVAAELCDVLVSDFMPSTLVGAVAALVANGACPLTRAVELVTTGPAEALGLRDRGRLLVGLRADLVLVSISGRLPTVRNVWSAEEGPS
jgi:alpha-D-ribose 1-methylphosphonate 5-triphosphate diphosphatase